MKDVRDPGTSELPLAIKRGRGRPKTGQAKSAAERMKAYRARSVVVPATMLHTMLQAVPDTVSGEAFDQVEQFNHAANERVARLEGDVAFLRAKLRALTPYAEGDDYKTGTVELTRSQARFVIDALRDSSKGYDSSGMVGPVAVIDDIVFEMSRHFCYQ
jgi:hypothetical protein